MLSGTGGGGNARAGAGADGFWVPAEGRPHELTFLQWPASLRVYGSRSELAPVQRKIAEIANTVAEFEPVILLADAAEHARARRLLSRDVTLWDVPTEDLWCRDSGPIVAIDGAGRRSLRHIQFNGWGGKQHHPRDGEIALRVAERLGIPRYDAGLVGEGGGVEQDGYGRLMAHESSWVNPNRNPGLTRGEIEARLLAAYGAEEMTWAPGLIGQDITDDHIDALARFTAPGRVLLAMDDPTEPGDPFAASAARTLAALEADGLEVETIPAPRRPRVMSPDFIASYVNYYVCNGGLIASEFGDPETDAIARDALARHHPDREVVMLETDALGWLGGGIHCATHELPVA